MRPFNVLNSMIFTFALLLLAFAGLSLMKVQVGSFSDWLAGLLAFFWLLAVVTVPWNLYFRAKAVLADAGPTRERGLPVDEKQEAYVKKLAQRALWLAIGLHLVSALVLFLLAVTGVSKIGYAASIVALLLTGLRPGISAYEYLAARLTTIGEGWKYPHEDVVELRNRVAIVESSLKTIELQFDESRPESLIAMHRALTNQQRQDVAQLAADLESLKAFNENEHERLSQETKSAISQLSTDGQFLEHVREIIRFFKQA